ncbi:hypothetical protein FVP74_00865 [Microbacterium saccharophilum]|uniref:Uncharacterized protein n=1 Tax=Microbacterium saccharophilum TaxID=1213358 RepID=A0A5C8I8I9_9MICO|nr:MULTISPECIES: hypothetical protein [Microbacterium]TXK15010.1 hypothetical protein FVP74_00865 [Microbacterium saccharophilum]GEP47413.1 hypothetical protein MSA03_09210 [Microbacterium saccharophilum]SFI50210.1 hypothetical protein SAMN04487751_1950 [Microbacterium saccharophilum]
MDNDYSGLAAGFGVGFFILMLVIYLAVVALMLWVGYLIMRTAVKNGVVLAMRETGQQFAPAYRPGIQVPPGRYPGSPG